MYVQLNIFSIENVGCAFNFNIATQDGFVTIVFENIKNISVSLNENLKYAIVTFYKKTTL